MISFINRWLSALAITSVLHGAVLDWWIDDPPDPITVVPPPGWPAHGFDFIKVAIDEPDHNRLSVHRIDRICPEDERAIEVGAPITFVDYLADPPARLVAHPDGGVEWLPLAFATNRCHDPPTLPF